MRIARLRGARSASASATRARTSRWPRSCGRFFLVANAVEKDPAIVGAVAAAGNAEVTEARNGEGFYEAVVRSLAEARDG